MIRENTLFCKLFQIKKSAYTIYLEYIGSINIGKEVCPYCGNRGYCKPYGSYIRKLTDYEHGKIIDNTVSIPRVICESCSDKNHKHTHGIITDCIIPYTIYSLLFILKVLFCYHCTNMTVEEICEKFEIAPVMIYRWRNLMKKNMVQWLGVLKSIEVSAGDFLRSLFDLENYSKDFANLFLRRTTMSFLQSHANPSNCRYPKFGVT